MQSVESVLKMEILNVIRAAQSVETPDEARKVAERYWSAVQAARALGYRISAISLAIAMNQLMCDLSTFLRARRVLKPT